MAIESIKRVTVVSPKNTNKPLIKAINNLGSMEIIDVKESLEEEKTAFTNYAATTEEADENLHRIHFILNLMHVFAPEKESFIKSLTPLPLVTSRQEVDTVIGGYNLDEVYRNAVELEEAYRRSERIISEIEGELNELGPHKDLSFELADFFSPKYASLLIGYLPTKNLSTINPHSDPWVNAAWEDIGASPQHEGNGKDHSSTKASSSANEKAKMIFAFLDKDREEIRDALVSLEFEEIQLPKRREKISDRINELDEDLAKYRSELAEVGQKVESLATGNCTTEGRRALLILKAYWINIREKQVSSTKGVHAKWVHILSGYMRTKDIDTFTSMIEKDFPECMIVIKDPSSDENVPVSISVPYIFKPIQLLTEMFGLPSYRNFDPTPFMQINFYIFFGICFSDVGYGLMLVIFSTYLARKTKEYSGVHGFSRILLYGGISSIVFGAVLGSWFGDLFKADYLGENNILLKLQNMFVLLDPMDKTIHALILALGIGVINQFFGIVLKMYGCIRESDWMGAFSDGLCWIVTLTGLLMVIGNVFTPIPSAIFQTGLWLLGLGALSLVLTQGRDAQSFIGKIGNGLVSLYGIVGGYGITAFIGDTLSYCRLLALGLTTSIVAIAFNLMAGMLRDIPYVGFFLFILVLIVGHVFNFLISVLGAFVHSMRLLFVEFFGRFYEGGARPFKPLGFDSNACVIKRPE